MFTPGGPFINKAIIYMALIIWAASFWQSKFLSSRVISEYLCIRCWGEKKEQQTLKVPLQQHGQKDHEPVLIQSVTDYGREIENKAHGNYSSKSSSKSSHKISGEFMGDLAGSSCCLPPRLPAMSPCSPLRVGILQIRHIQAFPSSACEGQDPRSSGQDKDKAKGKPPWVEKATKDSASKINNASI